MRPPSYSAASFRSTSPPRPSPPRCLSATAHGIYEATINGQPVTDSVLNPGWTAYEWRLRVQQFDVTSLLTSNDGDQVRVEAVLGNGWYRGDLGFEGANANYGPEIGFLAELVIRYADGTTQTVVTDPSWTARVSAVPANSLYVGQTIDARLRGPDTPPLTLRTVEFDRTTLTEHVGPLTTRQETLTPIRIWTSPAGKTLLDFGQNLVGWIRLRATGEPGHQIVLRHAEVLEHDELGTRPLRAATATDTFILSGGHDVFEPTLTFHGFRYAEITGFPGELTADDLEAVVVHSAMARTGWFECSDPRVNQLVSNSVWGQKGNFLDVPTDCPQRDERLGWTGDIAAYAATAAYQFDVADFLHKWLLDVAAETEHNPDHYVPYVVPDPLKYAHFSGGFENPFQGPCAIWGDAAVWVPASPLVGLRRPSTGSPPTTPAWCCTWSRSSRRLSDTGLWDADQQLGDWLDPDASPHEPANAKADKGVVATASFYRSVAFAADTARELGRDADVDRWTALASKIKNGFLTHYVHDDGTILSDCATVYALAICFGLLDHDQQIAAGNRLAEIVADRELHHQHRLRRHPVRHLGAVADRTRRPRLPAAAARRLPVLAVHRVHGRHHHLGALGLHAPRRHHQPRRHDLLQPLRPRRRRRLALQDRRRHPTRHPRLRHHPPHPHPRPRPRLGQRCTRHPPRTDRMRLAAHHRRLHHRRRHTQRHLGRTATPRRRNSHPGGRCPQLHLRQPCGPASRPAECPIGRPMTQIERPNLARRSVRRRRPEVACETGSVINRKGEGSATVDPPVGTYR